jgi:hypothetical protein
MEEEIDEIELLPFRVLSETGSAKFVAKERFIHRRSEPRFFVLQLSPKTRSTEVITGLKCNS